MLTLSSVTVTFGGHPALADVDLAVPTGARFAVVGENGAGKSTLLRVAAGLIAPDHGEVQLARGATAGYLPQDYVAAGDRTVGNYLKDRVGLLALERRLRALEQAFADGDLRAMESYGDALDRYAALGGYEVDATLDAALDRVGLNPALCGRDLATLSGGQQVRVGLAGVLAARHDLLLLDEPTNNLDLTALELLEEVVATSDATFMIVSHDRAFLDRVATDVAVLDPHSHGATTYRTGFAEFRRLRARDHAAAVARHRAFADERDRLVTVASTQRVVSGQDRHRGPSRDGDKFAKHFFAQRKAGQAARNARRAEARLSRLDAVEEPREGWDLRLSLDAGARGGDLVVAADGAVVRRGAFVLGPVSLAVHHGERVVVDGANGAGKSSLLGLLAGDLEPESGTVRRGPSVRAGVLTQSAADLARTGNAVAHLRDATGWTEADARTLLAKFDLGAGDVLRPVASLSPGERCRLGIAVLVAQGANLLLLDEPTNHLDLDAAEELERALSTFDGTLIVVSHDRAFRTALAPTRRLSLSGGGVTDEPW